MCKWPLSHGVEVKRKYFGCCSPVDVKVSRIRFHSFWQDKQPVNLSRKNVSRGKELRIVVTVQEQDVKNNRFKITESPLLHIYSFSAIHFGFA